MELYIEFLQLFIEETNIRVTLISQIKKQKSSMKTNKFKSNALINTVYHVS